MGRTVAELTCLRNAKDRKKRKKGGAESLGRVRGKGEKKRKQVLALGQPRLVPGDKGKSTGLVGALL